MKTFIKYITNLTEAKGIRFPPEILDKLHEITNKMFDALLELNKEEIEPNGEKIKFVDKIEFNDPYTNKQKNYNFYAAKFGEEHKNSRTRGYQQEYSSQPHIVITTNVLENIDPQNQKNIENLKNRSSDPSAINYRMYYDQKAKILNNIFAVLSHELAHAYDPTLTKGYRNELGAPEEYMKLKKAADDYLSTRNIMQRGLDTTGIGKLFGRKTPDQQFNQYLKDKETTKLKPYIYHEKEKPETFDQYVYQEPEFVAVLAQVTNSLINYARQSIKNDDPNEIIIKSRYFTNAINFLRTGNKDKNPNPILMHLDYYLNLLINQKERNPKLYRKYLESMSKAALEAYNIIQQHINKNNLNIYAQISPEVKQEYYHSEFIPQLFKNIRSSGADINSAIESYTEGDLNIKSFYIKKNNKVFKIAFDYKQITSLKNTKFYVAQYIDEEPSTLGKPIIGIKNLQYFIQDIK